MKPGISNLVCSWCLPRSIIKFTERKRGCDPGLEKLSEIRGDLLIFPQQMMRTTPNLVKQLEFAKAHHKITPRGKRKGGFGLRKLLKILGFP